jgi:cytidine deaminase
MLLPHWQAKLEEKYGSTRVIPKSATYAGSPTKCKKVVILVSGVGSPRNWTHSMDGNSTEDCAKLMKLLIQTLYPDWVVVQVHSTTNLFRYDENISFVQNELLPCIQSYRDAHATGLAYPDEVTASEQDEISKKINHLAFDPDWRKSMSVTLSFADGSPARNYAIQAALRPYKPTYFHCWQLKTFWHELKIVDSDIEVHTFEEMETLPPIDLTTPLSTQQFQQQQPIALQVVEEMKTFKAEMETILKDTSEEGNDIRSFWLRKTRKPVLAVLAVQMMKDGPVKLYRGTNMEVSMPTGSLCAERNVIGTALAANPMLKRHHLKTIAVLSVPVTYPSHTQVASHGLPRNSSSTSLGSMSLGKTSRSNSVDTADPHMATLGAQRPPRPISQASSGEWLLDDNASTAGFVSHALHETNYNMTPPLLPDSNPPNDKHGDPPLIVLGEGSSSVLNAGSTNASPNATPVRRISLYQHHTRNPTDGGRDMHQSSRGQPSKRKTVVVVQSPEDLNPLRPCGACNEWLKKIAETNPYFQILTFTDKDCNGVYCTPCAE